MEFALTKPTTLSFASPSGAAADGIAVVFAEEGGKLTPAAQDLDKKTKGLLRQAAKIAGFKGKQGTSVDLLAPQGVKFARIVLVGLGKLKDYANDDWLTPEDIASFALGAPLRNYTFDKYKSKKAANNDDDKTLKRLVIHCADPRAAGRAYTPERAILDGVNFARDLVNEPANVLNPAEFAARAKTLTKAGVQVTVLSEAQMKRLGMGALLAVGQGSENTSHVAVMQWKGGGQKGGEPIAIVGKGVTFDTGGISLKPAAGMEDMKGDMGGAACVAGLMLALAERKAKVNAVGVIGLVENMPSGTATRPGDVVESMSGTTIEVLNTDAEGRMVLADCLWYVQEKFKPKAVINLATLTGAVMVALGKRRTVRATDRRGQGDRRDAVAAAARSEIRQAYRVQGCRHQEHGRPLGRFDLGCTVPAALHQAGYALGASGHRRHRDGVGADRDQSKLGIGFRRALARPLHPGSVRAPIGRWTGMRRRRGSAASPQKPISDIFHNIPYANSGYGLWGAYDAPLRP